jgi:hypothetical protein
MQQQEHRKKETPSSVSRYYDEHYIRYKSDLYHEIRQETYGEDLGQNGWLTGSVLLNLLNGLTLNPKITYWM